MRSTPSSDAPPQLFSIAAADDGVRLDRALQQALQISRRDARLLISEGRVLVGGRSCRILTRPLRANTKIAVAPRRRGDKHETHERQHERERGRRQPAALGILALERYYVAVDKPAGLLSEPDRFGSPSVLSVLSTLLAREQQHTRLWLVHRLDASTSGVMVLARTPGAAAALSEQFAARRVKKHYLALCRGELPRKQNLIDAPIERVAGTRHAVRKDGRPATTGVATLWRSDGQEPTTLVLAAPRTGRTHQIRVHLAHAGCPILGDRLYGGPTWLSLANGDKMPVMRALLHAARIKFFHPHSQEPIELSAALPGDLRSILKELGAPTNTLLNAYDMHYKPRPCPKNVPPA